MHAEFSGAITRISGPKFISVRVFGIFIWVSLPIPAPLTLSICAAQMLIL